MKKIIRGFQAIRNNWKKSAFAACAVTLGANYANNSYNSRQLMRRYCEVAAKYGDESHPLTKPLRRITVILNPAAKKRKCKDSYEKYCAPLLHLAGVMVTVVQTEFAGQAKDLPEALDPLTDAIVIAGGDGTISEVVTGLLRRAEGNLKALNGLPIAILPLGHTNDLAGCLVGNNDEIRSMADATMSVIDGSLRQIDVVKIEPISEEGRPVYAVSKIEWGSHRDARAKRDKFWLFGPLREYVSYLWSGSPRPLEWNCQFCEPCRGCSLCYKPETISRRWWQSFVPKAPLAPHLLVPNKNCGLMQERNFSSVRFSIATDTLASAAKHPLLGNEPEPVSIQAPQLHLQLGQMSQGKFEFTWEGWSKLQGVEPEDKEVVAARYLKLIPTTEDESWFSIDNEDFEVKPVALTLLPKALSVFIPRRDRSF